ncbi:hypothetical protein LUZ61_012734 [Rhynchospora tenuis]|uniref:Cytochrome P450 n=1 Tax=Rhynchospora tenuis TaxID=198213 RepID=A0AAD6F1J2_9POAL|nr:hypothetical protein LUZ61_012734 [Rhynchospora tenuis]
MVCTDPDVNKYLLSSENKGIFPGYPRSFSEMVGKWNPANLLGSEHKSMRSSFLSLVNTQAIKEMLLPKTDVFMQSYVSNWSDKILDFQKTSNEVLMRLVLKLVASKEENSKELEELMHQVSLSLFTPAISFPGTTYNKSHKARRKLVQMLGKIIEERKASKCSRNNDVLDTLLRYSEDSNSVIQTDEQIIDHMISFVLSGYETASTILMMAVKYLHDHPHAQDELRKENLEIRKGKPEDYKINWDDYKSMSFTRAVVLETLRMASLGLGFLRRTTVDTEIKGYIIPKGWKIFVCAAETSKDPDTYPEPLKFNPWRWLSNMESHQYFMLFGGGARVCAGKEVGILEVSMFLHYLVTRYRWEEVGENKIVSFPRVEAPNGLYYRLHNC